MILLQLFILFIFTCGLCLYIIIDLFYFDRRKTISNINRHKYLNNRLPNKLTEHTYNAKLWITSTKKSPVISFPELCGENTFIKKIPDINKVSISISGGGSRSFIATMGYFRALNRMGYKNKEQYVSSVSGGSWFYGLYSFSQRNNSYNDAILLGNSCGISYSDIPDPKNITMQELLITNNNNKLFYGNIFIEKDLYEYLIESCLDENIDISKIWNNCIGNYILELYNINNNVPVALNYEHAMDIMIRNPDIGEPIYLKDDVPFWICNTTLFLNERFSYDYINVPMTPLYSGIPQIIDGDNNVGGYVIENYAFGNHIIESNNKYNSNDCTIVNDVLIEKNESIKTLSDMIGSSSTAFASIIHNPQIISSVLASILPLDSKEIIPKYNIVVNSDTDSYSELLRIGDGAFSDYLGILGLLSRGVRYIICFNNTETSINNSKNNCDNSLLSLFGLGKQSCLLSNPSLNNIQVFDSKDYDSKVLHQFQNTYDIGGPTFARTKLNVLPNKIYGIDGNYIVDILFIMLQPSRNFIKELNIDIRKEITYNNLTSPEVHGEFNNFPNYLTFFQNLNKGVTSLTLPQINLLSSYTDWCLQQPELKKHIIEMYNY